jgi:hypothetical protein
MATYTIEDIVIELIIQLPSNYPLGSITVESGKRVGVAVQQWRNWMLQLSTYLTHQVCFCLHTRDMIHLKEHFDTIYPFCLRWKYIYLKFLDKHSIYAQMA